MAKRISRRTALAGLLAGGTATCSGIPTLAASIPLDLEPCSNFPVRAIWRELLEHELDVSAAMIESGLPVQHRFLMRGTRVHAQPVYLTVKLPKIGEMRSQKLAAIRKYMAWTGVESFIQSEANEEFVISRFVTRTSMNVCLRYIKRDPLRVNRNTTLHAIRLLTPDSFPTDIEHLLRQNA